MVDIEEREQYTNVLYKKIGWKQEEPEYHSFSIDNNSAVLTVFEGGEKRTQVWHS